MLSKNLIMSEHEDSIWKLFRDERLSPDELSTYTTELKQKSKFSDKKSLERYSTVAIRLIRMGLATDSERRDYLEI